MEIVVTPVIADYMYIQFCSSKTEATKTSHSATTVHKTHTKLFFIPFKRRSLDTLTSVDSVCIHIIYYSVQNIIHK